jgi:hypothetical protein
MLICARAFDSLRASTPWAVLYLAAQASLTNTETTMLMQLLLP